MSAIAAALILGATLPTGAIGWAVGGAVERVTASTAARGLAWSSALGLTLAPVGVVPFLQNARVAVSPRVAPGAPQVIPHLPVVAPAWVFSTGPVAELMVGSVIFGAAVSLGVLAARLVRLNRLRRLALPAPAALATLADGHCPVRISTEATTAILMGLRRPIIVLPRTLVETLAPEELRWVCAHELAHLQRGDHLWALIDRLIAGPFWFNPPLAAILRRRADARETACDALALRDANAAQRRRYAETLVQALRLSTGGEPLQPAFIRRKGPGHAMRLKSILNPEERPRRQAVLATAGLATAGALSVALVSGAVAQQLAATNRETNSSLTITSDRVEVMGSKQLPNGSYSFNTTVYTGSPTIKTSSDFAAFLIKVDGVTKPANFNPATIPAGTIARIEVAAKGSPVARAQGGTPDQTVINIATKSH